MPGTGANRLESLGWRGKPRHHEHAEATRPLDHIRIVVRCNDEAPTSFMDCVHVGNRHNCAGAAERVRAGLAAQPEDAPQGLRRIQRDFDGTDACIAQGSRDIYDFIRPYATKNGDNGQHATRPWCIHTTPFL